MTSNPELYLLGLDNNASARLNLQHFWTQSTCGYLIHSKIPVSPGAKIADIGTGTGIWALEASKAYPTAQVDGFDITDAQFPPKEWLPANVALGTLDILGNIPEELVGQYDVVHIRYFGLMVRQENLAKIATNLSLLLKSGGYLQWVEVDVAGQVAIPSRPTVSASQTAAFCDKAREFFSASSISYDWVPELGDMLRANDMVDVGQETPEISLSLSPIFSFGAIGGWVEMSHTVLDRYGPNPILGSGEELRKRLALVKQELQSGVAIKQQLYVTLGRRV